MVLADINEEGGRRVIAAEIRLANGAAAFVRADIMARRPGQSSAMVAFTVETLRPDRHPAQQRAGDFAAASGSASSTLDAWQHGIDVGLTAYWYATRSCAVEHMLPRKAAA